MFSPADRSQLASRYFFSAGKKASDDYDQFWIRYKPERAMRKRIKHYQALVVGAHFGALLLVAGLLFCNQYALSVSMLFIWLAVCAAQVLTPTHMSLSDNGLQLHWLRSFCNINGPLIGWDRLSHVSIKGKARTEEAVSRPAIEFNVLACGIPIRRRLLHTLLAPRVSAGWLKGDRCSISLSLDGIASSDDRKRLGMALKKFLPSYRIDPSVTDEMGLSIRVESYTNLWMDALTDSPKRLRSDVLSIGTTILDGRYEVVRHIGGGGQAVVYEAICRTSAGDGEINESRVVLKEFVLPAHAGVNVRKRVLGNIQREADMLRDSAHPNIVSSLGFFVEDQRAYLILEHIDGVTLKEFVDARGSLDEHSALKIALQMCQILMHLHAKSPPIVHRDFTPDNLMIDADKLVKLIDFNVAEQLEASDTNTVVGKHSFIPPEQFRGKSTPQSDIYAFGASLFFMVTGEEPEPITQSHPRQVNSDVGSELDKIVAKATAIDVAERYRDCKDLLTDLQNCYKLSEGG